MATLRDHSRALKKLIVLLSLIALLILGGTAGYMYAKQVDFVTALVYTFETLALLHQRETVPIDMAVQIAVTLLGVIVLWWALWTSLDLLIEGRFQEYFKRVSMMKKAKRLAKHYIICGGGRVGAHIAELLKENKHEYVIIEREEPVVNDLHRKGYNVIEGDVMDESVLVDAGIKKAEALITVLPETEKNILVTLTAKEIRPDLKVYARADRKEFVKKLRNAGADFIVIPELLTAEEITKELFKEEKRE